MKIGDLLRRLADYADDQESGPSGGYPGDHQEPANPPELNAQAGTGESPDEVFVAPLQQKHELLKKSTGVENNVDQFAADDPNEIARMQQMAGIQPAAPVLNQTIVINNTDTESEPTVQSTSLVPEPVAEPTPEQTSYEDNYNEAVVDVGSAFNELREEFEAIKVKKGKK